jgi:hypothetical protein
MIRGDLSNRLIHLTKGNTADEAANNFINILRCGHIRGGNGFIRGGYTCVCFSEAPISVLSQILANPSIHGMRYAPFGVMVSKLWLFRQGGRPAIYQPEAEYELLHEEQRYRHVRYDPDHGIDLTWEREWRLKTAQLALDPGEVTFVVPTRAWEKRFMEEHAGDQQGLALVFGEDAALAIESFPWHFVVLEDLGVEVSWA